MKAKRYTPPFRERKTCGIPHWYRNYQQSAPSAPMSHLAAREIERDFYDRLPWERRYASR